MYKIYIYVCDTCAEHSQLEYECILYYIHKCVSVCVRVHVYRCGMSARRNEGRGLEGSSSRREESDGIKWNISGITTSIFCPSKTDIATGKYTRTPYYIHGHTRKCVCIIYLCVYYIMYVYIMYVYDVSVEAKKKSWPSWSSN